MSSAGNIIGAAVSVYSCANGAAETAKAYKRTVQAATEQTALATGDLRQQILNEANSIANPEVTTPDIERDHSNLFAGTPGDGSDTVSKWIVPGVFGAVLVGGLLYAVVTRRR